MRNTKIELIFSSKAMEQMPENQGHGKTWEKDIGVNVYKATLAELDTVSHTAPIDVPRAFNRLEGIDISIKVSGKDTIDMADVIRVYDEVSNGETIHMTVVLWEQKDSSTKKLKSITEVDLTNSVTLLFGSVKREQLVNLVTAAKAVGKVRAEISKEQRLEQIASAYSMRDELHKLSGFMHLHLMFYTNNPSRVQGQFTQFRRFLQENPSLIIAKSDTCEFRGGKIAEEIVSTKRIRHKKPAPDSAPH
jgi:hypothetical protein